MSLETVIIKRWSKVHHVHGNTTFLITWVWCLLHKTASPVSRNPTSRIENWIKNVFDSQDNRSESLEPQIIIMTDNYQILVIQKEFWKNVNMIVSMVHHLHGMSIFVGNNWKTETFLVKNNNMCFWWLFIKKSCNHVCVIKMYNKHSKQTKQSTFDANQQREWRI